MYRLLFDVIDFQGTLRAYRSGEFIRAAMKEGTEDPVPLEKHLRERGYDQVMVREITPDIEDCFMALMNNPHPVPPPARGENNKGDQPFDR
jgi:hypothetical protein